MLVNPGLSVVGGLAMAFGIWFGAVTFQMFGVLDAGPARAADGGPARGMRRCRGRASRRIFRFVSSAPLVARMIRSSPNCAARRRHHRVPVARMRA
jgi:hypothetical protein